ncbi:hypothetical protein [Phenylobacterium sp.]|uniref:hypothetical protein n=1 Tax=Phenylobacterium sp. TaxID=1871053 RepID=UPI0035B251F7
MLRRQFPAVAAAVAALALGAGAALAASPHDGAWESTAEGTYWSNGQLPKDFKLTLNLKFGDNRLQYHSVNTTRPDKPFLTDYETSLDGKPNPFTGQPRFDQISVTRLGPDEFQILKLKGGDVIIGEFWTFSADGKTLVRRGVAKSPEGISKAYQETFIRK